VVEAACRHKDKSPPTTEVAASRSRYLPRPKNQWPVPQHVKQCWNNRERHRLGVENQNWWVWSWPVGLPSQKTRRPYTCGSWRCAGKCATHAAHVLFARLHEAVSRPQYSPDGWVFAVLTLDRLGTRGGQEWPDAREAYRALGSMGEKLLKRWRRLCEAHGWESFGSRWAVVVESHRSGWPHANVMLYAPELARELEAESQSRAEAGFAGRELSVLAHQDEVLGAGVRGELGAHAVACGWGIESTVERCRSTEALAGYMVKLARVPDGTMGELAKLTQLPHSAPFRFRRLRSGKGFLPPVKAANPAYTGALVKRIRGRDDGLVWPEVPKPKGGWTPERQSVVDAVLELETRCLQWEEMSAWTRIRGRPRRDSPVGPVSLWLGKVLQRATAPPPVTTWDECAAQVHRLHLQKLADSACCA